MRRHLRVPLSAIVVASYIVFISAWSYIGISKFYSLSATVYDLGISMQSAYFLAGHYGSMNSLIGFFLTRNGLAFLLIPVALTKDYPLMIVVQASVVGAAAFPIYGISLSKGASDFEATILATSYLIFFPLSGLLWFDFHYQMFFVLLFLSAYYFYKKRMFKISGALFLLAGLCRYPFMIFPFIFSVILLAEILLARYSQHRQAGKPLLLFSTTLMVVSLLFLVAGYILIGGVSKVSLHTGASMDPFLDLNIKLLTIVILYAPLLFVPFFSYRAMILSLPFLYLVFTSNTGTYTYPSLLHTQYSVGIVPFLYIGFMEGLSHTHRLTAAIISLTIRFKRRMLKHSNGDISKLRSGGTRRRGYASSKRATLAVLLILAVSSIFMQPYGPMNYLTGESFHFEFATNVNMSVFNSLESVLSLIPSNESHVLIQNNIVEALPGPVGATLLVPQYDVGPNITYANIANNSFPTAEGNAVGTTPINFAVADINNQNTLLQYGKPAFPNMLGICRMLLSSHFYGIRAEENGIILLQRGYDGAVTYVPFVGDYHATEFLTQDGIHRSGLLQLHNPVAGTTVWFGPFADPYAAYLSLVPGVYTVSLSVGSVNASLTSAMYMAVLTDGGNVVLNSTVIHGAELAGLSSSTSINIDFTVGNMASGIEFQGVSLGWNGTVVLNNVQLKQISTIPNNGIT